jgi:MSHA biogenesis protein MshI
LLETCAYRACDISNQASTLASLVDELNLKGLPCSHVLQPGEYTLLFVEAPDVEADELKSAVRWRIKDLIDFHIDDAVIDVFDIPGQSHGNRPQMMYVVAAQSAVIQKKVELIQNAGLDISIIDIPELTQRNISTLLPEDVSGVALLYLSETSGLITLCRQSVLYLTRVLDIGTQNLFSASDTEGREHAFDSVVLEVQRSLDYYESHYAQAPIKTLVVSSEGEDSSELINYLNQNLGVTSRMLDIDVVIDSKVNIDVSLQTHCMPAIGAALRSTH